MTAPIVLPFSREPYPLSKHEMRAACDADEAGPESAARKTGQLWERVAEGRRR